MDENKMITRWIQKERTLNSRQNLQMLFWTALMITTLFSSQLYSINYHAFLLSIPIIILLIYLIRINGKIGLKQQKEK